MEPLAGFRINLAAGWRSERAAIALGEPFSRPAEQQSGAEKKKKEAESRRAESKSKVQKNIGFLPYLSLCIPFLNIANEWVYEWWWLWWKQWGLDLSFAWYACSIFFSS